MKADAKGFKFLNMEGKVKIPFFQRTYVWDKDNWEDLLGELLSEKTNSFLGAIILKQLPSRSGEPKELEVIDGQQRLTTLSILLKALYDTFSPNIQENCKAEIESILRFKKDYASASYEIRIEHSHVDSEAYQKVINNPQSLCLEEITEKSHKILQCYKYFAVELNHYDENKRRDILNKILNPENKMLVVIDLEERDDEQTIFDTLNTAGVRLTTAEIIKNALFKRVIEILGSRDDAVRLYEDTWKTAFLKDAETTQYWETERTTGRLKRDNIEILLHCIGVIKGFFDPDKHTLSDLSRLYKEEIGKINSDDQLKSFVNKIIEYAKIYKDNILSFDKSSSFSFEDSITRLLHVLEVLEISTFHPFILYIFKQYRDSHNQIVNSLCLLERFVVKNAIAKVESVKNYNKLCKQFIQNISNLENKLTEFTEDQISRNLQKVSNREATLLLFWIELYRRHNDQNYEIKELKYTYTLEHIMPQKWEDHWTDIPTKYKSDGSVMTNEEAKQDRNDKIFWLGNMTLLKSKLNSALRNLSFERKMEGEERKKGIKAYAELSITKDDIVTPYEIGNIVWNESKIEERTRMLKDDIMRIWS